MISVLFAARDSIYKTIPGLDVWDEDRDALLWPGGNPGIFHPPCRLFSKWMRHFSKAEPIEKNLARWSVGRVRENGGVLEHPACSLLWNEMHLPKPGSHDRFGLSIAVRQQWFGHKAEKATWLYICGGKALPPIPFVLGYPEVKWDPWKGKRKISHPDMQRLSNRQRQSTPIEFAKWLVSVASQCV